MRALIIAALAASLAFGGKSSTAPARHAPACPRVDAVTLLLEGQYAAVACGPQAYTVSVATGQPAPAVGPARVAGPDAYGVYRLVTAGQAYVIGGR